MCKWSNQSENVFLKEKTMIIKNPKIWPFPNSKSSVARNRKAIASRTIVSKNANADVEKGKWVQVQYSNCCILEINQRQMSISFKKWKQNYLFANVNEWNFPKTFLSMSQNGMFHKNWCTVFLENHTDIFLLLLFGFQNCLFTLFIRNYYL